MECKQIIEIIIRGQVVGILEYLSLCVRSFCAVVSLKVQMKM